MATFSNIHSALTQSLITLNTATLGSVPIAHEGRDYSPSSELLYLQPVTIYGESVSLDKNQLDEVLGVYQITVRQRDGEPLAGLLTVIDGIIANYRHNATLTYNDTNVVIINSTRNALRNIDGWQVVDISISFKTDHLRT